MEFRIRLQDELVRRCRANPAYSMRAFARSLRVDPPTLSKLLSGRRPLGRLAIERLGSRIGLPPDEIRAYLPAARTATAREASPRAAENPYQQLSLDAFRVISDWYHYAILELMRLEAFRPDLRWIARKLGIQAHEARSAVERLERLGFIETSGGRWVDRSGGRSTTTGMGFTDTALRNLQSQVLTKALEALESVPMERRDQTSMTMAIDSRKLALAKERITKFRRTLARSLGSGGKLDAVYHLSVSLYPVTKEER